MKLRPLFVALLVLAPALRAADAAPRVAKPNANAPVTVKEEGESFVLDNGIVNVRIDKRRGELEALTFRGQDVLGHDQGHVGGWEQDPSNTAKIGGLSQGITIDPATN